MASLANSRKRPAPKGTVPGSRGPLVLSGIDGLLAKYARTLPPGGSVSITLVKGATCSSVDPIAARRAAAKAGGGSDDDDAKKRSDALLFPRMAKFPDTIAKPDFQGVLKDGRMYEEEVPKAKDESDEEAEALSSRPSNDDDNDDGHPKTDHHPTAKKRKRRWRRHDPRPRRWVLQEKSEFFERVAARRRRQQRLRLSGGGMDDDDDSKNKLSNQYHGVMEANSSKYVLLSISPTPTQPPPSTPTTKYPKEQIQIQSIFGFHTFSQPHKLASLSMEEAENAIERQRNVVTRYMMHGRFSSTDSEAAAAASGVQVARVARVGSGMNNRPMGPPPKKMSRARLLGKLAAAGDENDEDDVMGDIKFSSSRSRGSKARKELLTSMADEGVTVDDDGVLGGANDSEFGGRRRFARVAVDKPEDNASSTAKSQGKGATGMEAGAMEEGFYQRDVSAEYEALDYDANEQFDDDDVNLGEDEIVNEGGGFAADLNDSGEDLLDSEEEDDPEDDFFKGMASTSGLKAMIAKARGEVPKIGDETPLVPGSTSADSSEITKKSDVPQEDSVAKDKGPVNVAGLKKVMDAAKKTAEEMEKKKAEETSAGDTAPAPSPAKEVKAVGIEKDKDGKRLITMEAIRREIWLNNGAIKSKRLMRKFDVTNKNPERQALFKSIVMELCTMKKDADGNKLVLKQHYAKSG